MAVDTIDVQGAKPLCISFNAQITAQTASALMAAMANAMNNGCDDVHLLFSTPGGSVADGIATYNMLRSLPARLVTYNIGGVNSIGNVVYQAGAHRVCAPTSSFMFHGVATGTDGRSMELKQLKERVEHIKNDQSMISDIICRHTGIGLDDVNKLFLEMAFVSSQEALQRGIADEVREIKLPKGLPVQQLIF